MSTVILTRRNTIISRKTFFFLRIFYQFEQELYIFLSLPEGKTLYLKVQYYSLNTEMLCTFRMKIYVYIMFLFIFCTVLVNIRVWSIPYMLMIFIIRLYFLMWVVNYTIYCTQFDNALFFSFVQASTLYILVCLL